MDKLQSSGAVSRVDLDETEGKKRTFLVSSASLLKVPTVLP